MALGALTRRRTTERQTMNVTMKIATALALSASIVGTANAQGKIYGAPATAAYAMAPTSTATHNGSLMDVYELRGGLSFPKIRSGRIRAVRENQTIIQCARPWPRSSLSRASCVEPLVRPAQARATSAAPPRSAASSQPRRSPRDKGRCCWDARCTATATADISVRHAADHAASTIFRSQRTARAPNSCRPSRAVRRCRRLPPSR
jgi:hypothetical protein